MARSSGPTHESVTDAFEAVLRNAGDEAAELGEQLFAVVDALDGSGSLRRALTDPAASADSKAALVARLLDGKVDDRVVELVSALARLRWPAERDLVDALEHAAADAMLVAAEVDGTLETVEDELFRLDRILVGERDLRQALTDPRAQPEQRSALVVDLLGAGKVHPVTLRLVERAARTPRGRTLPTSLQRFLRLAGQRRERMLAMVTVAAPLTPDQVRRLERILERTYGRPVTVHVTVAPEVVGGVRVQIGSEVIDSTVLARLDDVRRRLAG